jgi:hypothetical protein
LVFLLSRSALLSFDNGSGLWHTPNVPNGGRVNPEAMTPTGQMPNGRKRQVGLAHQVRMIERGIWPTPTARDWRSGKASEATMERNARPLSEAVGGQLNPEWVEWLMGFPPGWTDCGPSETPLSRRSRKSSSDGS